MTAAPGAADRQGSPVHLGYGRACSSFFYSAFVASYLRMGRGVAAAACAAAWSSRREKKRAFNRKVSSVDGSRAGKQRLLVSLEPR